MRVIRRRRLAALLLLLSAQLLLAARWRWPWTTAPIQTSFDFGTGHVAIVSENWRRHGALRQHFLPVMSTDPDLPEWPYRTEFSQEYVSVPPLAFILHYVATRVASHVEPVLLGKLLAQGLIAASVIVAAPFLYRVFGGWPTLIGLSFLIWGVPSLLWFANGYFAVNVGLAVQLVLVAWCASVAASAFNEGDRSRASDVAIHFGVGAALAFLGGFADYLPLAANAIAIVGLFGLAALSGTGLGRFRAETCPRCAGGARALASAGGVLIGSLAAVASTAVLYGRQMGFARYRAAITQRIADRSGEAVMAEHFAVIRRQLLRAWPRGLLIALCGMLGVVLVCAVVSLVRRRFRRGSQAAIVTLLTLALSIVPSLLFHYRAVNYVRLHWWFAGTWSIGWAITLCAFVSLVGRLARLIGGVAPGLAQRGYLVFCVGMLGLVVGANVRFVSAQWADDPGRGDAVRLYRSLGQDLPPDGLPLVVTDLTIDWPGYFEDFPYTTAYLRRPVLLREPMGAVRVSAVVEPYLGGQLHMGGEDVRERLIRRGGDVYVAYDPNARTCRGTHVPLSDWHRSASVEVCRISAADFVQRPDVVLGAFNEAYRCSGPPAPPRDLRVASNSDRVVVLSWAESLTARASYILEVGKTPGQHDLLTTNLGRTTRYRDTQAAPGTYYVRVRGTNACGAGGASNELGVIVP